VTEREEEEREKKKREKKKRERKREMCCSGATHTHTHIPKRHNVPSETCPLCECVCPSVLHVTRSVVV
jgi:hypothetical protein